MTGSVARRERAGLCGQELRPGLHGAHPGQHHHPPQGRGEYCIKYTAVHGYCDDIYNLGEPSNKVNPDRKLNSVMDCESCFCQQPISAQKFFLLQFHWMLTTTTFAI